MLSRFALEGTQLPYKSTVVAGLMSSLIPGTGEIYAGRFNDGLYSLITIGLTGWQAYEGFTKDGTKSTKGWIYGTLAMCFYFWVHYVIFTNDFPQAVVSRKFVHFNAETPRIVALEPR